MSRPLRKQFGGDEEGARQQSNVEHALGGLKNAIITDGVLIENVTINGTWTLIPHKLGRPARGFIVIRTNALTQVAGDGYGPPFTHDRNLFINLIASTGCVVSLWIF